MLICLWSTPVYRCLEVQVFCAADGDWLMPDIGMVVNTAVVNITEIILWKMEVCVCLVFTAGLVVQIICDISVCGWPRSCALGAILQLMGKKAKYHQRRRWTVTEQKHSDKPGKQFPQESHCTLTPDT